MPHSFFMLLNAFGNESTRVQSNNLCTWYLVACKCFNPNLSIALIEWCIANFLQYDFVYYFGGDFFRRRKVKTKRISDRKIDAPYSGSVQHAFHNVSHPEHEHCCFVLKFLFNTIQSTGVSKTWWRWSWIVAALVQHCSHCWFHFFMVNWLHLKNST